MLLCWLALLLVRVAERRTGMTWRRIATELGRMHAITLTGSVGTAVHTTPLTTTQAAILRDSQLTAPALPSLSPAFSQVKPQIRRRHMPINCGTRAAQPPAGAAGQYTEPEGFQKSA